MTPHDKVIHIIQLLELSDSKVARAIQKSTSAATHKRMRLRDNKFTEEDYQNIRAFYLDKLRNIENLEA
nr:MAG TPA: EB1-like C-terminal motif [Caudoviricetes sp.]